MAIQIKTKKLSPWKDDLADRIKVDMLNEVVTGFAEEATVQLGKLKCQKHPGKTSYITITPDRKNTMIIRRKFCCPDFKKKISIRLAGYLLK